MTTQQQQGLGRWMNKYGIPMVACIVLYVDFVRPLRDVQLNFTEEVATVMHKQTAIMEKVADNQEKIAKALETVSKVEQGQRRAVEAANREG